MTGGWAVVGLAFVELIGHSARRLVLRLFTYPTGSRHGGTDF